ncbi:MAG: DUF3990 domain-containing protein [Candidatus Ornithomonoglobus sp.]
MVITERPCRYKIQKYRDVIVGAVADDDVFKTVDMYARGIWDKERVLKELRYYKTNIDLRTAMNIYYKSRLAEQIEKGIYGIENMDYKYLVQDLIENEGSLFEQ